MTLAKKLSEKSPTTWSQADFVPSSSREDEPFHIGEVAFVLSPGGDGRKYFAMRVDASPDGAPRYLVVETTTDKVRSLFSQDLTVKAFFLDGQSPCSVVEVRPSVLRVVDVETSAVPRTYFSERQPYWTLKKGVVPFRRGLN